MIAAAYAVSVPAHAAPAWARVDLPQGIDPGPNGRYGDLRIVDDRGRNVPYVVDPSCASIGTREVSIGDAGFVPGRYTQAVLDVGDRGEPYSVLSLSTPRETFFNRVRVAISDDRTTWREMRSDALIYRVADTGDPGSQTMSLAPARARWIRVRILDGNAPFPLDGASLDAPASPPATVRLRAVPARGGGSPSAPHVTQLTYDLTTPHTQLSSLHFETAQREFARDVTIETSDDGETWDAAGAGHIARFASGAPRLDVPASGGARYVRVTLFDGDDRPLPQLAVSLAGPKRLLAFVAEPGRSYALVRVRGAHEPVYDLTERIAHDDPRRFLDASVSVSPVDVRPAAVAPAQRPLLLQAAFAVVILALGWVTIATLRSTGREAS